jgi:hypothetical protein
MKFRKRRGCTAALPSMVLAGCVATGMNRFKYALGTQRGAALRRFKSATVPKY